MWAGVFEEGVNATDYKLHPELDERETDFYKSFIGILRWIVEMGRLDICM